jgi:hypothetical protein
MKPLATFIRQPLTLFVRAAVPFLALCAAFAWMAIATGHAAPAELLIKSSPNNPQLVRDVDNPARNEPFQVIENSLFGTGATTVTVSAPAVPAGQRLVIEHVSAVVELSPGSGQTAMAVVQLVTAAGSAEVQHALVLQAQGTQFASDNFTASQPIRIYARAGDRLQLVVNRSSGTGTGQEGVVLGATGYFLPE